MSYIFSSTDQLIDSVYPVQIVQVISAGEHVANANSNIDEVGLEMNMPNMYRLRFQDRLSSGRGEPEDAAVILEKVTALPGGSSEKVTKLFTWPIEYIRRYGSETKNIFILELGRRCAGFANKVLRFDTRPAKSTCLESDFAVLVKKVLKFMDPSAQALAKKQNAGSGVAAFFTAKHKSHFVKNAVSCEYAELAPYQKPAGQETPMVQTASTDYARVVVEQQ